MTLRVGRLPGLVVSIALVAAPAAMAQDEPRLALLAYFPSPTVSFQWDWSEKFALRLEGSYHYRNESLEEAVESISGGALEHVYTSGVSTPVIFSGSSADAPSFRAESITHGGSLGVVGIFTIYRTDRLRLYAAPRISVAWLRQRVIATLPPLPTLSGIPVGSPTTYTLEDSSTSPGAGASFGAVTNVHRHLALFGEAGVTYSRSDAASTLIPDFPNSFTGDTRRTAVNTRAVAGLMVMF